MKTAVPCYYHLDVEVRTERVGQVRRILAAHLRFWDLENLVEPVCRGAEVLLCAIDEHAADKNTSVEMWWNGQHLITAVGGNDPTLRPDHELRSCLQHIAALSDGWGCCATVGGGQVIWFTRRARAGERVPLVPTDPEPITAEALQLPRAVPVPAFARSIETGAAGDEAEVLEPVDALDVAEVLEVADAAETLGALDGIELPSTPSTPVTPAAPAAPVSPGNPAAPVTPTTPAVDAPGTPGAAGPPPAAGGDESVAAR